MISKIRARAKTFAVAGATSLVTALIVVLPVAPASAVNGYIQTFVSAYGNDNNAATGCQPAAPCQTFNGALSASASFAVITCLTPVSGFEVSIDRDITIDCRGMYSSAIAEFTGNVSINISTPNIHVTLRGLDIVSPFANTAGGIVVSQNADLLLEQCRVQGIWTNPGTAISFQSGGRLTIRDSLIHDNTGGGIDLVPGSGNLEVAIQNTIISGNSYGISVKPSNGATVYATFDHVTITQNNGGGLKSDTTNGGATLDVSGSTISNNGGNGINAVGGGGGQNIVSIQKSVIARNGGAGVQANGATAGVLLATTLLDQNGSGATSIVSGGNMFSYGTNSIVGGFGSGFNNTATLH